MRVQQGSSCLKYGIIFAILLLTTSFVSGPSCANALPYGFTAVSTTYNNTTESDRSTDSTNALPDVFTAVSTTYNNTTETNMSNDNTNTNKTEKRKSRINSGYSCDANEWDGDQHCLCKSSERISVFKSEHNSHHEDRIWRLQCAPLVPKTFSFPHSTNWYTKQTKNAYDGVQEWDGTADDSFLVGMESHHDNHREDRQYTLFTAKSANWLLNDCTGWTRLNEFDKDISHTLSETEVIAAVYSHHNNRHEDREFYIKKCQLIQKCTEIKKIDYDLENANNVETKGVFACRMRLSNSGNSAAGALMCQVDVGTASSLAESYQFSRTSGHETGLSLDITAGYKWGPDEAQGSFSATIGFSQKWSTSQTWSRSKSTEITESTGHRMRYTGNCEAECDCTLEATMTRAVADIPYTITSGSPGTGEECTEYGILKAARTWGGVGIVDSICKGDPVVIQWKGLWGSFPSYPAFCPSGSFVFGYRLRSQSEQGGGDDTALNDIELYCRKPNSETVTKKIWSDYLYWGTWSSDTYCSGTDNPVVGFDVREEGYQGGGDDTALNEVDLYCKLGWYVSANVNTPWGYWKPKQMCPKGFAVMGIRTQVEGKHDTDDTALNGVELYCKEYPNGSW